jgi:hypothetical protein
LENVAFCIHGLDLSQVKYEIIDKDIGCSGCQFAADLLDDRYSAAHCFY